MKNRNIFLIGLNNNLLTTHSSEYIYTHSSCDAIVIYFSLKIVHICNKNLPLLKLSDCISIINFNISSICVIKINV